jgi:outer membrane biosynthesis protein TonB
MRLPGPVRAAIGLVATATEEARHLPERAIELPMLAVSTALQMSLRAQQRYARLTARGDQVLRGEPGDEPPEWATFDDPVADHESAFDRLDGHIPADVRSFADLFAVTDPEEQSGRPAPPPTEAAVEKAPPKKAPAKKTPAKKAAVKKAPAKKAPAKNAAPAKVTKRAAAKAPAKKAARGRGST